MAVERTSNPAASIRPKDKRCNTHPPPLIDLQPLEQSPIKRQPARLDAPKNCPEEPNDAKLILDILIPMPQQRSPERFQPSIGSVKIIKMPSLQRLQHRIDNKDQIRKVQPIILKTKPFDSGDTNVRASDNERACEADAGPGDSDKTAGGEMLRYTLEQGSRAQGETAHSKLIRLDGTVSAVPGLQGGSRRRMSDRRSYGGYGCGLSTSLTNEDGCW